MKIVIKAEGHNIRLWFPLSILKSRIAYGVAKSSLERQSRKDISEQSLEDLQLEVTADTPEQVEQIKQEVATEISLNREQMVEIYNILKQCVKVNGHFNIVEVQSRDGDKVLIRV